MKARGPSTAAALGLILVITSGCNGSSTPAAGSHASASGASASATKGPDTAYLNALRPVAASLLKAVTPSERVVEATDEPKAGDYYSARDAFAHGEGVAQLKVAVKKLDALKPPGDLVAKQQALVQAAGAMSAALGQLHGLGKENDSATLQEDIDQYGKGDLEGAEVKWDTALTAAYKAGGQHAPAAFRGNHLPTAVSKTAWIFRADRSCTSSSYRFLAVAKLNKEPASLSRDEATLGLTGKIFVKLGTTITALPRPSGHYALSRELRTQLKTIDYQGTLFDKIREAFITQNAAEAGSVQSEILQSVRNDQFVAKQMRAYGAVDCGSGSQPVRYVFRQRHAPDACAVDLSCRV